MERFGGKMIAGPLMTLESNLGEQFLSVAIRRAEFLNEHDAKRANREFRKLDGILLKLRQLPDRGLGALRHVCEAQIADEAIRASVQIEASGCLLAIDEPYAIAVLERIALMPKLGLLAGTAKLTLQEWRKGNMAKYRV